MFSDAMLSENECCLLTTPLARSELASNISGSLVPLLMLPFGWDMGSGLTGREDVSRGSDGGLVFGVCFGDPPFSKVEFCSLIISMLELMFSWPESEGRFSVSGVPRATLSSSGVGVLFPSSIPESELEVLEEDSLSDLCELSLSSSASLLANSCGSFGGFCRGRGTGVTVTVPASIPVGEFDRSPVLGRGDGCGWYAGGDGDGVVGLGVSGEGSTSKLV